jgi:hypothetical protein
MEKVLEKLFQGSGVTNVPTEARSPSGARLMIYPKSLLRGRGITAFVGSQNGQKKFWILDASADAKTMALFEGERAEEGLLRCPLSHRNAMAVRTLFPFARPVPIGLSSSLGCGDRLGLANAGHLHAVAGSGLKPVLAQQSVRELQRTNREAEDVLDAATWAVLQEGYREAYGADGDHLKTPEDIDRYARAGYTLYTLDVGASVANEASRMSMSDLALCADALPWGLLETTSADTLRRFAEEPVSLSPGLTIRPEREEVLRAMVKYGAAIAQAVQLTRHLESAWSALPQEVELSVDETDSPTTPFEHLFIAAEMRRLGVRLVSLAPRFIGDFEKGVEYKGDLRKFAEEYGKHVLIAERYGPYKISVHSGSDKFKVYEVIGSLGPSAFHVKTAGTSWLEALRTVAAADQGLFRTILECAKRNYEKDRATYLVSADVGRMRPTDSYRAEELLKLLSDDNARQILHVTYGSILAEISGGTTMKDRILKCLEENERKHYEFLERHFRLHIQPLLNKR